VKQTKALLLSLSLTFIVSTGLAGACGQQHLSSSYAQSYTAWFSAQHVKPKGAEEARKIIESLDAPEAAAVSRTYRKGRTGDDTGGSRMLMIGAPRTAGPESYTPSTPSVPQ
jgi:hypothetical protein